VDRQNRKAGTKPCSPKMVYCKFEMIFFPKNTSARVQEATTSMDQNEMFLRREWTRKNPQDKEEMSKMGRFTRILSTNINNLIHVLSRQIIPVIIMLIT
jgi:hypothetical protein